MYARSSPTTIGTELRDFFKHASSHDPNGVHAAACVIVNEIPDEPNNAHVCQFIAGGPNVLAEMFATAIDRAVKDIPGFKIAWDQLLHRRNAQAEVDALLNRAGK